MKFLDKDDLRGVHKEQDVIKIRDFFNNLKIVKVEFDDITERTAPTDCILDLQTLIDRHMFPTRTYMIGYLLCTTERYTVIITGYDDHYEKDEDYVIASSRFVYWVLPKSCIVSMTELKEEK